MYIYMYICMYVRLYIRIYIYIYKVIYIHIMSPYHPHLWTRLPGLPGHQEADVGTRGQRQAFVHLWRCRFFNGEAAKMFGKMVVWPKMLTILTKFIPYPRERIRQKWDETDSECLI